MSEEKTYNYNFECSNCGRTNQWKIPFGTKVEKFLRELQVSPCPHCGCSSLAVPPPV